MVYSCKIQVSNVHFGDDGYAQTGAKESVSIVMELQNMREQQIRRANCTVLARRTLQFRRMKLMEVCLPVSNRLFSASAVNTVRGRRHCRVVCKGRLGIVTLSIERLSVESDKRQEV